MSDVDDTAEASADPDTEPRVDLSVCVVQPKTPGNVGTIARAMKNFGVSDLLLVDPPELERDGEAYGFAGHAREDVLPNAREVTFDEVCERFHTVGFTAITGEDSRRHVRFPFTTPEELTETLGEVTGPVCLVFGREGKGLSNEELARLDQVASIPASPDYPVMNLGQAATVTLYALRTLTLGDASQLPDVERHRAAPHDVERLNEYWDEFVRAVGHKEHKLEKTTRLFRRVVGRADLTDREANTLMGVFRRATARLDRESDPREAVDSTVDTNVDTDSVGASKPDSTDDGAH
jgi:tRNA (cytidine32/uridine32-2'-O)-methyltransferase